MAVEKMKLINIIGPLDDFDRVVMDYVIGSNIHLENVFNVFTNQIGFMPFDDTNPYVDLMKIMDDTLKMAKIDPHTIPMTSYYQTPAQIMETARRLESMVSGVLSQKEKFEGLIGANEKIIDQLQYIAGASFNLNDFFEMKNIKVRFGRLPRESYKRLNQFLGKSYATIFFKFSETREYVYGVYCSPISIKEKVDTIFSSLYFERLMLPDKARGVPSEVIERLRGENEGYQKQLAALDKEFTQIIDEVKDEIYLAYSSISHLYQAYDIRRYAAHTKESFYIAGWVPQSECDGLSEALDKEPNVTLIFEEPDIVKHLNPPTKLKNNRLIRPFESFVAMYGLPSYNEFDPTGLFAITYSLMFGIMYGDVGHGLVLALVGFLVQRRGNFLGPILKICGFVSAIFGVLFGSIFGFELEYSFMYKPMATENIMKTLIGAVVIGAVIITVSMIVNMMNGFRQKDIGRILFDANGVAGFVFYWAAIIGVISAVLGNSTLKAWYIGVFVVLPLVLVFLKKPLANLVRRRKDWMPKEKGQFFLENAFEMLELILSYITNTISFIRVGAFALNHAGMMMVVYSLANVSQHSFERLGFSQVMVLVLGNVLVLGLEGLLVAIQVLRLEFYEMFSRYYSGQGRPFSPKTLIQK
jgi:V/A-type H+-transporting ATPase subunit I